MRYIFAILFIGFSVSLSAQKRVWEKFGDQSMELQDGFSAAKFYEKAIAEDSSDYALKYKLAKAYMAYQNFEDAVELLVDLQNTVGVDTEGFYDVHYDIGKSYKHLACLRCAKKYFGLHVKNSGGDAELKKWSKNELSNMEKVRLLQLASSEIAVKNIGSPINTGAAEFAAFGYQDTSMLFSSLRAVTVIEDGIVADSNYTAEIYKAKQVDSSWVIDHKIEVENLSDLSIANSCLDSTTGVLYFSACEKFGECAIYQLNFSADSSFKAEKLPSEINLNGSSNTHPWVLNLDGKKYMYFASSRAGGYGGMDIWVSEYKKGWMKAKNLGKNVNTRGNEITPSYDVDSSRLYFSSDWHYNLGGFDIFYSKSTGIRKFEKPVNIGRPYNSPLNDLYFTKSNSSQGFLTSSREGSVTEKGAPCCNDLYEFKTIEKKDIKEKEDLAVETDDHIFSTLHQFVPTVYFHNDRPNVDSWDILTNLNYLTTYERYVPLYEEYKTEFSAQFKKEDRAQGAKERVIDFFENKLFKGKRDLEAFSDRLLLELDSGRSVDLTVRGFASPLTTSRYNVNLSLRRISSIMNFLAAYRGGAIQKYMTENGYQGVQLNILKDPNGEYKSAKGVSDDYYDVRNSIYNPSAALERKVELRVHLTQMRGLPIVTLTEGKSTGLTMSYDGTAHYKIALHNTTTDTLTGVVSHVVKDYKSAGTNNNNDPSFTLMPGELLNLPLRSDGPDDVIWVNFMEKDGAAKSNYNFLIKFSKD